MFGRVLVFRAVAASDVSAGKAHTQAHPAVAGLYAVLAHRYVFRMNLLYLVLMRAIFSAHDFLVYFLNSR